jgi:hypothetical protein
MKWPGPIGEIKESRVRGGHNDKDEFLCLVVAGLPR